VNVATCSQRWIHIRAHWKSWACTQHKGQHTQGLPMGFVVRCWPAAQYTIDELLSTWSRIKEWVMNSAITSPIWATLVQYLHEFTTLHLPFKAVLKGVESAASLLYLGKMNPPWQAKRTNVEYTNVGVAHILNYCNWVNSIMGSCHSRHHYLCVSFLNGRREPELLRIKEKTAGSKHVHYHEKRNQKQVSARKLNYTANAMAM